MNIEQAVRSVVDVKRDGPAILETVEYAVLEWPVWYYEMYGKIRPSLTGGSIKPSADIEEAIRTYVTEYSKELGKNFEEEAVQAVLDRLINYRKWALTVVENAYWGQVADDTQEYFEAYGSGYGSGDSGAQGEY